MMVGLLAPHAGHIRIEGHEVPRERDAVKSLIGYVPDRPHVYGWMRVRDAIAFAKSFYPRWNDERCAELMKLFELKPRSTRPAFIQRPRRGNSRCCWPSVMSRRC